MPKMGKTYQEQAYEYVKSSILNLNLKPGEYITDQQVADEMNISRTPVREAFRLMQREGLLDYQPRRGWKVYTLTLDDIHEIFDIKVAIEGMTANKASQCTEDDLRNKLKGCLEKMREAKETDNRDLWLEVDPILHLTIFEMAKNERAHRIIENINDQWHRVKIGFIARTEHMNRSFAEHEAFVDAILDGKGQEAQHHMSEHLNNIRAELVHLLTTMVLPYVKDGV